MYNFMNSLIIDPLIPCSEGEPITPHQTTLLKLLDSYFRDIKVMKTEHSTRNYAFLTDNLLHLLIYAQQAIKQSLKIVETELPPGQDEPVLQDLDVRLPKVSAGLILLAQCVNTICVQFQDVPDAALNDIGYQSVVVGSRSPGFIESLIGTVILFRLPSSMFKLVLCFIEVLRLLDQFLPRIVFGKAVPSPNTNTTTSHNDTKGFAYLKRDLVRLAGTLCYNNSGMQNRVRECEGIPVIMNLCVIDERNPCESRFLNHLRLITNLMILIDLQEHSLFVLRNILHENPENQAVVDALKRVEDPLTRP